MYVHLPPFWEYYQKQLGKLQLPLVIAEITIGIFRIFTQSMFSLVSTFSIIQPLLIFSILTDHQQAQCKIYIVIGITLSYTLISHQISWISDWKTTELSSTQAFRFHYRNWGYWIEIVVRVTGIFVVWKSYCFSKIKQRYEDMALQINNTL